MAVAVTLLCTAAALTSWPAGTATAAGTADPDVTSPSATTSATGQASPSNYAFAPGALPVDGASGTTDAALVEPGKTYRSSLPESGKVYYRLDLDDSSNAYVSVTAAPPTGGELAVTSGIKVWMENADGRSCSFETATFGASRSPHPITTWGARTTSPRAPVCEGSGAYYVVVERSGTTDTSPGAWDLELTATTEPRLKAAGATSAPEAWDSASPSLPVGQAEERRGGAGFAQSAAVGQGVWHTDIEPGQTLFYEVPVGWGQQLSAAAELGSSDGATGLAPGALDLALYNPVRADVEDASVSYDGRQKTASLDAVPPVDYVNRYSFSDRVNGMRFAGSYYLVVHLAEGVADKFGDGPFGLSLRIGVKGGAQSGPGYAGQSVPRNTFEVAGQGGGAAADGGAGGGGGTAMTALAVGGIGGGTAVLVGLGVWTVVARRKAGVL
ncbi:hypothetical protein [Streptomyces pseudovenezuelae]|uniref:Peptidase n=1 Tax=Streptomyces pseudovenezuelae TaxID=67350 RepID=A0ABT6LGE8_9ACTN|nr:hypothetical protein [Streptomyces pseudovenezuelae]MDH6215035.1 hypothetical protein [Streptomyces pseudovenezuelae]